MTLGNLADEGMAGRLLVGASPGMLHSLVALLYSKHADVQAAAAGALRNLAKDSANVRPIADGSLERIVWMLEHGSSDVVKVNAAGLFANLATYNSTYADMRSITALVALQHSNNKEVVQTAQISLDTLAFRSRRVQVERLYAVKRSNSMRALAHALSKILPGGESLWARFLGEIVAVIEALALVLCCLVLLVIWVIAQTLAQPSRRVYHLSGPH
jgi:hypothetical protein